jgi:hypothetical protein
MNCMMTATGIKKTTEATAIVSSKAHPRRNLTVAVIRNAKKSKAKPAIMRVVNRYRRTLLVGLIPHTADDILIKSGPISALGFLSTVFNPACCVYRTQCLSYRALRRQTIANRIGELLVMANGALILSRKRFLAEQCNQAIGLYHPSVSTFFSVRSTAC